jgi:hypothetical protein
MSTALLVLGLVILGVSFWLTVKTYKTPKPSKPNTQTGGFTYSEAPVKPETKDKLK